MSANSLKTEKESFVSRRGKWTLHLLLKKMGTFILGTGMILNSSVCLWAQAASVNSPQNFLSRLRPNFTKSANSENTVQSAPSAFSELAPSPAEVHSSENDGWVNLGTDYSTPSSEMIPVSTSKQILRPQSRSFNPGSREASEALAPAIPAASGSQNTFSAGEIIVNSVGMSPGTQSAAASSLPAPFPVNQREFHLPIGNFLSVIPENQLKEIRLYVSRDNGQSWKSYQTLTKSQIEKMPSKNWGVRTASDGEFWFALRLVDQNGNEFPQNSAQPTWRILVNSTGKPLDSLMNPPREIGNAAVPGQSASQTGTNLLTDTGTVSRPQWSPTPDGRTSGNMPNSSDNGNGVTGRASQSPNIVIYSVKDRGVNSIPDISLPVYKIQNPNPMEAFQKFAENSKGKKAHQSAKPESSEISTESDAIKSGSSETPDLNNLSVENELNVQSDSVPADLDSGITLDDSALEAEAASETENFSENDDLLLLSNDSFINEDGLNSKVRFMNQPNLSVEYDVSTVGSSGVGRVELWSTLDDGMTWTYLAEDEDCVSPVQVTLKSDGKYGFQILVFNGAGVGMERPQAGSASQMEVVLDRIAPRVQIYSIQLQAEFGDLEIQWGAEDLNFGSNPVLLSWASSTEGPWRSMTSMPLENTGRFTWRIPEGIPGKVFIRLDVCDQAKNATTLVTGPVVTDIVRPTGVILDAKPR
ncbi:MAG: hypothetical protein E7028_09475 [Planctomycetaceae bacterium]|nr:hypothetical protein [Planctomycetaceae bacterium]